MSSPASVTCGRTIGQARNMFSTALTVCGFLAASAVLFAFNLESSEGGHVSLAVLWAESVSPILPALAAFLAMDVWSEERQSGRIEVLLSTAVRERDLVVGKFFGVLTMAASSVVLSLLSSLSLLCAFAPSAVEGVGAFGFMPAFLGVLVQSVLWCAVSVAMSAMFSHAAAAAVSSMVLMIGLPRGIWAVMMAWSQECRALLGAMPFDAHAADMASGVVSVGAVVAYLVVAVVMLFIATKRIASLRFVGVGALGLRISTGFSLALALVLAGLVVSLALRTSVVVDLPVAGASATLSSRTRSILMDAGGDFSVTCFLSRKDPRFRQARRFLQRLKRESAAVGGARFEIQYVDPRWDIGAAERLIRRGVAEDSLVFERGRRIVSVPFRDGYGERVCASAIRRLTMNARRRNVYWTVGHGENRFDEYGVFGMSDIARELARDGYRNQCLDLAKSPQIPGDCALVVIAGSRNPFSRVELGRLDSYLREGGRLLVLLGSVQEEGVLSLLSTWGVRPTAGPIPGATTLSGSDVIVSDFSEHPISAPLRGSRIVLERPVSFAPSASAETGAGADRIDFSPLANVGQVVLAAAVERGAGAGSDLAIRPTRIVVVGDASFVMNGQMMARANANRDFLLNCAAYLSGTDVVDAHGDDADLLTTGMDRDARLRHLAGSAAAFPGLVFLVMVCEVVRRRRRS